MPRRRGGEKPIRQILRGTSQNLSNILRFQLKKSSRLSNLEEKECEIVHSICHNKFKMTIFWEKKDMTWCQIIAKYQKFSFNPLRHECHLWCWSCNWEQCWSEYFDWNHSRIKTHFTSENILESKPNSYRKIFRLKSNSCGCFYTARAWAF